jgi:uncharacterized protein (DUF302 family)
MPGSPRFSTMNDTKIFLRRLCAQRALCASRWGSPGQAPRRCCTQRLRLNCQALAGDWTVERGAPIKRVGEEFPLSFRQGTGDKSAGYDWKGVRTLNDTTASETPPSVEGIVSRPSPFSVEETVDRLLAVIHNRNLTLFARIDHSDLARGVGLTMQEAHVLIFGNPKGGTPLMIASPLLALDLPLKVLVWQSQDAQVWVSTTSVAYLSERYALPQELVGNLAIVNSIMQQAL